MQLCRLHIMGASGSGTTTLGRAIANAWSVPHADSDDYFWVPTSPPYTTPRPVPERIGLMRTMFVPRDAWVLSGAINGWAGAVLEECDAVVFLTLDPQERMRRLAARETLRRGGDIEDQATTEFMQWARGYDDPEFMGRSRRAHEDWLASIPQPVLRLDSGRPVADLKDEVLAWEPALGG
ncbi:hypothetical protein [Brachybacterium sp. ACRRE]|uniref:hypothetical protein n=1 Tax=Brachybacterium sp. ACRRE TaxID=2918184 RepID=UPI001EF36D80|nr:hypothetical protein [Brachybacterium sp. ACRRE]MCG7311377.1 hypothetical protein [Brachybacterium sp. ACRRE]